MGKRRKSSKKESQASTVVSSPSFESRSTRDELYAIGKSLREKCPRESHADWQPATDRPDPIMLMEESNKGRIPELIPIRHGRMLKSPFTFYRGAGARHGRRPSRYAGQRAVACRRAAIAT